MAAGALLLLALCSLQASPLKAPRRLVNGQLVELKPLFTWWTNHSGPRPLAAWVHLTGPVTGTNSLGWIIDANIEATASRSKASAADAVGKGREKVVLQRPPVDDLVEFERLTADLKNLNQERGGVSNEETQAKSQQQTVGSQRTQFRYNRANSRLLAQEEQQLRHIDDQAKAQLKLLDQQIQALKSRLAGFPSQDHYEVDCFALEESRSYEHMPLYDHGLDYP
jgi:hypothetical protein